MSRKIFFPSLILNTTFSTLCLSAGSAWGEIPLKETEILKIRSQKTLSTTWLTPSNPIVPERETIKFVNQDPNNWQSEPDLAVANNSEINSNEAKKAKKWRFSLQPTILLPFSIQGTASVEGPILVGANDLLETIEIPSDAIPETFLLRSSEVRERANDLEFDRPELGTLNVSDGIPIRSIDFDLDLEDVLSFDRAIRLSGRFEAWRDRLGFTFDGQYSRIKQTGDATIGPIEIVGTNGNTITTGTAEFDLEFVSEMATFDLATSYHFGNDTRNQSPENSSNPQYPLLFAEPYAGIRISYLGQEAKIDPGPDIDVDTVYVDPILGARLGLQVSDQVTFAVRGDVGGFGVGSNLTWFLVAGLDWQFVKSTSLRFAYRIYDFDFDTDNDNDFSLDYQEEGIWLGFNFYL